MVIINYYSKFNRIYFVVFQMNLANKPQLNIYGFKKTITERILVKLSTYTN